MITLRQFILPAIIGLIVSTFTLWLVEHPIKYFFFAFQFVLTATLAWIFMFPQCNTLRKVRFSVPNFRSLGRFGTNCLDYLLMFLSASLLLLNAFNIAMPMDVLLAFIVVSLVPGYVLLRLTGAFGSLSYLETFILSYTISLGLNGILSFFFVPMSVQSNRLAFLSLVTLLAVLPILKDLIVKKGTFERKTKFEFSYTQFLMFAIIVCFFSVTMIYLYPKMSLVPSADIVGNFSKARLWSFSPALFVSTYPFFHIYLSAIYSVSTPSLEVYQTFLAFTSATVLLSFYLMAKKYLDEIDNRLPIVATVFWAAFSGFGWVYLFERKLEVPNMMQIDLLSKAYNPTYADIGYGLSTNLWLWYTAMTVSFTIFFVLLYLLKCKNVQKSSLMVLISILVMTLYFVHVSELLMFVVLIIFLSFTNLRKNLHLNEALSSTFIGLLAVAVVSYLAHYMLSGLLMNFNILPLACAVGLTLLLKAFRLKESGAKIRSQITKMFACVLIIFFIAGLLGWFSLRASFSMNYVGSTFLVPWFFYPVRLGIIGLLGLLGMFVIAKQYQENGVAIFPFLFFIAWVGGRLISFVNTNLFSSGYWEWRFLFFSFAAASIASTILLKHVSFERVISSRSLGRVCLCSFLLSLLVMGGVLSTFLTIEERILETDESYLLSKDELEAISFLSSSFMEGNLSPLFTITSQSAMVLEFVPSPWVERNIQPVIWSPKYSEVPFTFMYNLRFSPPYIYLHQRDLSAIDNSEMQNGYIGGYLLQLLPEVYNNSEVKIFELPEGVPPLNDARSILVISSKKVSENDLLASYILSLGEYNYTTMFKPDPKIFESDTIIFPSDSITLADIDKLGGNGGKKIIVLNLDGYGPLSRTFFESEENETETMKATHITTPDGEKILPSEINVSSLAPREGVNVLAWYIDNSEKAPLVTMQMLSDQIEVLYFNVYPMTKTLFSSDHAIQDLLQIHADLLSVAELSKYDKAVISWVIDDKTPVFAFKEGSLEGNISVYAESIIPSETLNLTEVKISINDSQVLLNDVTSLSVQNIGGKIALSSQDVEIGNGRGFYAFITASNPETTITGEKILISALTSNGTYINVEGSATARLVTEGQFSMYLRNPSIHNIGEASFQKAYALHSYLGQLKTMGQDLFFEGDVEFGLPLSDEYNVASNFTWKGTATREPPDFTWDELRSVEESIPYFMLAVCILSVSLVATKKLKIRISRRGN